MIFYILRLRDCGQCIPVMSQSKPVIKLGDPYVNARNAPIVHNNLLHFLVGLFYAPALLSLEAVRLVLSAMKC